MASVAISLAGEPENVAKAAALGLLVRRSGIGGRFGRYGRFGR